MSYDNDLRRWESRRRVIADHYRQSGSLAVTAKAFGISRQRVLQIVQQQEGNPDGQDHAGGSDTSSATGTGVLG